MSTEITKKLLHFIEESPCSFHAVAALKRELDAAGFLELKESDPWHLQQGGHYYVIRNSSSILSFSVPEGEIGSFHIIAAHCDSPCFKIKPGHAILGDGSLLKLNVEKYGGAILTTWFDRPLSVAGRVVVDDGDCLRQVLVHPDRDLVMIPSLAIHMTRSDPEPKPLNLQSDSQPIIALGSDENILWKFLAEELQVLPEQIISSDLYLCSRQKPVLWGAGEEFIGAPRLDDLECCYCSFLGFLESHSENALAVHCVFDSEEIGSRTRQGADSSFLRDVLERISDSLGFSAEQFGILIAKSFLVSADNAHAVHPNYPQKADPVNRPALNRGIVLKYQAEQRYATDAFSAAVFKKICLSHGIPFQEYTNRADIPGGVTLAAISETQLPLPVVDIGLPQLAMHSAFETAGSQDPVYLADFAKAFYSEPLPVFRRE